jgi:hypothetical protein
MGYTYLFQNYRLWKLKTHWVVDGPHTLHGKHYPQNPRIALLHKNSVYLIRNRLIYRLDESDYDKELEIRTIDTILDPPPQESIQSGFTYDKRHYIFTKQLVYVYDSTYGNLLPGYPKSISNGWFACESASNTKNKPTIKTTTTTAAAAAESETTTVETLTTKSSRNYNDGDDDPHFHHHHHHHHRHRRPFPHRHHHHHQHRRPPPPPPFEYRAPHQPYPFEYRTPSLPPPPYDYHRRWDN